MMITLMNSVECLHSECTLRIQAQVALIAGFRSNFHMQQQTHNGGCIRQFKRRWHALRELTRCEEISVFPHFSIISNSCGFGFIIYSRRELSRNNCTYYLLVLVFLLLTHMVTRYVRLLVTYSSTSCILLLLRAFVDCAVRRECGRYRRRLPVRKWSRILRWPVMLATTITNLTMKMPSLATQRTCALS